MKDILLNFERESNQMSATRGLQSKSEEQTFILRLDRKFRFQYSQLFRNYQVLEKENKSDFSSDFLMIII